MNEENKMSEVETTHLFNIKFKKNGISKEYRFTACTELDAAVRLGQIYGDDRNYRQDLKIEIISITKMR